MNQFDPAVLEARVSFLASDALGGRAPGTLGDLAARMHLEDRMRWLGLTAIDSTGARPPAILLSLNGAGGSVNDRSCIARLKQSPNAEAVKLGLAAPPTNSHTYVLGPSSGGTTTCKNNGD